MVKFKPQWSDVKLVFWVGVAVGFGLGMLILAPWWNR